MVTNGKKGNFLRRPKRPKSYSLERLGQEYNIDFGKAGKPEDHLPPSSHLKEKEEKKK